MPTNRKHGEGSVYFEESRQKWVVAFFDAEGKRHKKRFDKDSEKEARAYLISQINEVNTGSFVAPSDMTIGRWLVDWLATYKQNTVKQTTYEYYVFISKYLKKINNIRLQDLQAVHVQRLYNELLEKGLSKSTVNKVHRLLKDMYQKAYNLGMMQKNVMQFVKAPKFEKKPIEIFTKEEIKAILETAQNNISFQSRYPAILLAVTTGMREGEILGLRWCDVDLSKNEIFIQHTLSNSRVHGLQLTSPKTSSSIRKISIPLSVSKVLKDLKEKVTNMDIRQETFIFQTKNGTLVNMRTFDKSWERILIAAQVPHRKFHGLRHTHATMLLAEGVPIVEVSRRLGHSKVAHTLDLYGQTIKGYDKKIAEKVDMLYNL